MADKLITYLGSLICRRCEDEARMYDQSQIISPGPEERSEHRQGANPHWRYKETGETLCERRDNLNARVSPTLRDQFAMAALTSLQGNHGSWLGHAKVAYEVADAMLKARELGREEKK